jgi:hypothetical protein
MCARARRAHFFPAGPARMETKRPSAPSACGKDQAMIRIQIRLSRPKPAAARLYASTAPGPGFSRAGPSRMETKRPSATSACGKEGHDSCPNKAIEAEASDCATLRVNGTGSRAVPWFEGAHLLRRCAPVFESAHLGKSRRFLRRCAPFSKVRTEKCAPSKTGVVMLKRPAHSCYPARR